MYFFRQVPSGELWSGYSVLYVPNEIPDSQVINSFSEFEIKEYTCLSNQYLPTDLKPDSCEISLLTLNQASVDYLLKRNNYFFDKDQTLRLYYVPVFYKSRLASCAAFLSKNYGGVGVDSSSSYPFLFPLSVFIFSLLLFIYSKKKTLFINLIILPVCYTLAFPFLSSVFSSLLVLIIFFVIANIFGRRDFVKMVFKKVIFFVLVILAFVSCFSTGLVAGSVFALSLIAEISVLLLFRNYQIINYKKTHFHPVMIRSSFKIPLYGGKEIPIYSLLIFLFAGSFVFSVFQTNNTSSSVSSKGVLLPSANSSSKSDQLPVLEDFYKWDYSVRSFPYHSLNSETDSLGPVKFSRFQNSNGRLEESLTEMEYTPEYKEGVYNKIDSLQFDAFEKIMKKQGEDFSAGYSSNGSHRLSLFCIIISFIQFSIILVYFAWILLHKKPKKKISKN